MKILVSLIDSGISTIFVVLEALAYSGFSKVCHFSYKLNYFSQNIQQFSRTPEQKVFGFSRFFDGYWENYFWLVLEIFLGCAQAFMA